MTPRLLSRSDAAAYCGVSPTRFSMWVAAGMMPCAVPGTRKWDKVAIDAKLDAAMNKPKADNDNGLGEWRKKRDARKAKRTEQDPTHTREW